ncbi:MAG: cofactor-independent phosphoglycerate mutase [Nitrospirae bacterium CG_4_10_14_0_8_um_filter_41_23]|nr:cofactor-independent phosphoglycerate mutase [Nitrospirota bacterium]PIQ94145.1 MAG: cofactor-independent phosphoglycerate mutase [Nitrospirae bacterium CG11_big_fil_rev_8_21_14_0_20_41_14]PIV43155.1 MAG: cofactor-independent phosphoglycerate mutase [Nitrospirae bacterium CG02_land_8_20_14_3_00_41_53]PIW87827.1 MAG: cofactor-independent phosphoglycerate mutase [Nitrospirae bacterium CG_4_8_14_3_um_filter_41_47]PIY87681.1 MAG: cofactor-independent phosphoglycerate mutase [Nitrospirae bacteriu
MKYVVIIGDGMADRPVKGLGSKTPLQKAFKPNMDRLVLEGIIGKVRTIPAGFHPGSDIASLNILGYNPMEFYSGRAPLEAASIGIKLERDDVAYRCNLVTLKFNKDKTKAVMEDYSGGHITTEDARELINDINRGIGTEQISFYAGVSYRHIMVWSSGALNNECIPPHDITGKDITDYLPVGDGEDVLRGLMLKSTDILISHPVNRERIKRGDKPANSIWLWGQGKKLSLPTFRQKYSLDGALVSAVDLMKGIGIYAGFEILGVPGITGYLDTNYVGKAEAALKALEKVDLAYIHVEAPDEAGHSGNYNDKVKAIEDFDALVVGTVLRGIESFDEYRILLLPDHATPIEVRTHTDEPVPFVIYDSRIKRKNEGVAFDESITGRKDILVFEEGYKLMEYFIKGH